MRLSLKTVILGQLAIALMSGVAGASGISVKCLELFAPIDTTKFERHAERLQRSAVGEQNVTRDLSEIEELMPALHARLEIGRRTPGFHWIDVGGGSGSAAIESFAFQTIGEKYQIYSRLGVYGQIGSQPPPDATTAALLVAQTPIIGHHRVTVVSIENILESMNDPAAYPKLLNLSSFSARQTFRFKFEYAFAKKLEQAHVFRYLHDRKIEDIPDEELGGADLITDPYGAMTYSIHKIQILEKYGRLLKPGGLAIIRTVQPLIHVHLNGKTVVMDLNDLVRLHPVPGLRFENGCLLLEKLPGTVEALRSLAAKISFLKMTDLQEMPPTYHYNYTP